MMRYGRYTTIVIGSDGKRYDLGKGEHMPWSDDETKRVHAVNAFVEWISELPSEGVRGEELNTRGN
jgi:hypothetical protein